MAVAPQLDPMVVASTATMTGGSNSVCSAKLVKEAIDEAAAIAAKKATDEAASKEATTKESAYDMASQKAVDDAVAAERAGKEIATVRAVEAVTSKEVAEEPMGSSSSPALAVGGKRFSMLGGSTPPSKRFHGSKKPRYAE
jgi:hypothetical protein